jgi:hypothetical protein
MEDDKSQSFLELVKRRLQNNNSDKCNTVNFFPVFYGGILNNFFRSLHVSPDQ